MYFLWLQNDNDADTPSGKKIKIYRDISLAKNYIDRKGLNHFSSSLFTKPFLVLRIPTLSLAEKGNYIYFSLCLNVAGKDSHVQVTLCINIIFCQGYISVNFIFNQRNISIINIFTKTDTSGNNILSQRDSLSISD